MNIIFLMIACTKTINFQITVPAQVAIDQEIKTIAPINREDENLSNRTMEKFMKELQDAQNPRFSMIPKSKAKRTYTRVRATEGQPLNREQTQKICTDAGVTGIITLEKLRLENKDWDFSTFQTTKERKRTITENEGEEGEQTREQVIREEVTMHKAEFFVEMVVDWKLYSCNGRIMDINSKRMSKRKYGQGESRSDAKIAVGETDSLISNLADQQGLLYMRRISPYEISATRKMYTCGPKKMKEGNKSMENGRFDEAAKLYKESAEETNKKDKGKSLYNLAIIQERTGKLDEALENALAAHRYIQSDMSQNYVDILRTRKEEAEKLAEQLGTNQPAEEPQPEAP